MIYFYVKLLNSSLNLGLYIVLESTIWLCLASDFLENARKRNLKRKMEGKKKIRKGV